VAKKAEKGLLERMLGKSPLKKAFGRKPIRSALKAVSPKKTRRRRKRKA
jgi:hypothetical protein